MNRTLYQSLLLGAVLLGIALLVVASCVPLGNWQTAVVLSGGRPVSVVHGPAYVWIVPGLETARVLDARLRTSVGSIPWAPGGHRTGELGIAWTWKVSHPRRYAALGDRRAARARLVALVQSAVKALAAHLPLDRLVSANNLLPLFPDHARDELVRDGVVVDAAWVTAVRPSSASLARYFASRKKILIARLHARAARERVALALLEAREQGRAHRLEAQARRKARLLVARVRRQALELEIAAARPAPSFFAFIARLTTDAHALVHGHTLVVRTPTGEGGPR